MLHQIGAGALGPVYRAYEPELDRLVAIKVFRLDVPPERIHQFVGELEQLIAADVTHPGIVAPVAAGITGSAAYLAQDFAAADSLDIFVRDYGRAPVADVVRITAQLASALDFAAAAGVVHGGLHPRDVLVSSDDTRVTGIGIVPALARIGVTSPVRRPYAAPERAIGAAWDRRADVFSLAALTFELLSGKRIAGPGMPAAASLGDVGGADRSTLLEVFGHALAEDPEQRYDSALAFSETLNSALQVRSGRSRPAAGLSRPARAARTASKREQSITPTPAAPPPPLDAVASEPLLAKEDLPFGAIDVSFKGEDRGGPNGRDDLHMVFGEEAPAETERSDVAFGKPDIQQPVLGPPEPAVPTLSVDDLDLRRAEASRYEQVESTPSMLPAAPLAEFETEPQPVSDVARRSDIGRLIAEVASVPDIPDAAPLPSPEPAPAPAFTDRALERTRSAVWPLVLALFIGIVIGAAATIVLLNLNRDRSDAPEAGNVAAVAPSEPAGTSGNSASPSATPSRAFTEGAVPERTQRPSAGSREAPSQPRSAPERRGGTPAERAGVPAAGRSAPPAGRLLVRSTPAGARVLVDGKDVGVTPTTLHDLEEGTYAVRVLRDGYTPVERRVTITATRPAQSLVLNLVPLRTAQTASSPVPSTPATIGRTTGTVFAESRPAGADVFVNGKLVGTTPLQIDLEPGQHLIRLERNGYSPWTSSVRVASGERSRVAASLER